MIFSTTLEMKDTLAIGRKYYIEYLDGVKIGLSSVEFDSDGMSNSCCRAIKFSLTTISARPAVGSDNKLPENSVSKASQMHRSFDESNNRSTLCFSCLCKRYFLWRLCALDSNLSIYYNL